MKSELSKPISTNFSKGLSYAASHLIDPEECQITDNFIFGDGTATVRNGTQCYGSNPAPVVALCRHYNKDGTSYLLSVAGGQCYVSYTSGVFTPVSSEPISSPVSIAPYDDYVYLASYPGVVKYFDGSSMNIAGISSPTLQTLVGDFTTTSGWSIASGTHGILAVDQNITHIGYGNGALQVSTSGNFGTNFAQAIYPTYQDLTHIADVNSDVNDLITIITTHKKKTTITNLELGFQTYSGDTAISYISNLSSWVGCSSDGWTLNHTIPKAVASGYTYLYSSQSGLTFPSTVASGSLYTLTTASGTTVSGVFLSGASVSGTFISGTLQSGAILGVTTASGTIVSGKVLSGVNYSGLVGFSTFYTPGFIQTSNFVWSSCFPYVSIQDNGSGATVTFSDCKLVKTPPIPSVFIENLAPTLFYGSSNSFIDRFYQDPGGFKNNLQGQLSFDPPILDGTIYYKSTFLKQGPTGTQIESNPSQQSSGCVLSTNVSSYLVSASGTLASTYYCLGIYPPSFTWVQQGGHTQKPQYTAVDAVAAWGAGQYPPVFVTLSGTATSSQISGTVFPVNFSGNVFEAAIGISGTFISSVPGANIVTLNDIPIAPSSFACNGRNIYRRMGTDPAFRFVYQIADNTTTQFIDNVPYQVLGETIDETRWPPPIAKYIYAAANQQTYYLNIIENGTPLPSRVRFSNPYEPYYVPLNNVFDVSPGDGTQLTGMFEFANLQFLLKERSTWLLDPSTGIPSQMHHIYGCIAPNSIAVGPNVVFWLSDDGIIEFNLNFNNISQGRGKINTFLKGLNKQNLSLAAGVYFGSYYLLAVDTDGTGSNDTVLVYDTVSGLWSKFPGVDVNCWSVWGGSQDGSRLFYGNNSGLVCEFLVGNDDMGVPIPWTLQTKDFGMVTPQEAYRELFLFTKDLDGQSRTIQATPFYDLNFTSSDVDYISTSGYTSGIGLGKLSLNPKDGASFFSLQFSSSGRVQVMRMDAYAKEESLR